jgi:hypothetical protein
MCVIALALTAFSGVVFAETADSLYGLAVNTHADPDGVEMPITFSWKLKSDRVGAKQIAYKLELAAEKNFDQILLILGGNDTTDFCFILGSQRIDFFRIKEKILNIPLVFTD